jgi:hypothetical protein
MQQWRVFIGTLATILAIFLAIGCARTAEVKQASSEQVKLLDQLIQTADQLKVSLVEYLKGERDHYTANRNAYVVNKFKEKANTCFYNDMRAILGKEEPNTCLYEILLEKHGRLPRNADDKMKEERVRHVMSLYQRRLLDIDEDLPSIRWNCSTLNTSERTPDNGSMSSDHLPPPITDKLRVSQEFITQDKFIQKRYLSLACRIENEVGRLRINLQKLKEGHTIVDRYLQIEIKISKETSEEIKKLLQELETLRKTLKASKSGT